MKIAIAIATIKRAKRYEELEAEKFSTDTKAREEYESRGASGPI